MIDCKHVTSTGQIAVYVRPGCPRAAMVRGVLVSNKKRCKGCRSRQPLEGGKDKAQKHGIA